MVVRKRYDLYICILLHFHFYSVSNIHFVQQLPQTNPGFNNTPFKFTKYSNAYMLVYIRVSDKDKIICDVDAKDIAEHLRVNLLISRSGIHSSILFDVTSLAIKPHIVYLFQIRLKKEQEEKEDKRRYKAQAHLYTIIKVILVDHFSRVSLVSAELVC